MGIRIHKILGWGLKYTKGYNDPRLNKKIFGGEGINEDIQISKSEILEYIDSKEKGMSNLFEDELKRGSYGIYDFVRFGPECSKRPFVIFCLRDSNWYRHDDTIDYYDADPMQTKVKLIVDDSNQVTGIYPYYGYINRLTGQPIPSLYPAKRWTTTNTILGDIKKDPENLSKANKNIDKLFGEYGVHSFVDWQRNISVKLSPVIEAMIDLSGIFVDPKLKFRLKPMLVTYWD